MAHKTEGRYKVEVIADDSGKWCSNALRFDSVDDAETYGYDLAFRWTLVTLWRVYDTVDNKSVCEEHKV